MIIVNLQLRVKPDKQDSFIEWFYGLLPETRNYDGCSELNACSMAGEPNAVDVISKWESQEKYDTYLAWRDEDGTLATLAEYLTEEPAFRFLTVEKQF